MTKDELEKATGQELIDERDYCGVDGYYGDYLDNVNAEMLKRFNRLAELEAYNEKLLDGDIEKHNKIVELGKQIEIDAEHIRALQKQNGELTDKVRELEAQIKEMKCCFNCKHSRTEYEHCRTDKHEKWEIKENDSCCRV